MRWNFKKGEKTTKQGQKFKRTITLPKKMWVIILTYHFIFRGDESGS